MLRLLRLITVGGLAGATGYWLYRYLRPEHSSLVLKDSVVVITGASSGIGRAYANAFARRGVKLALVARRAELLETVRAEVEPYTGDVLTVPADLADMAQIERAAGQILDHFGRVDILINNAGVAMAGMLHEARADRIQNVIQVNVTAAIVLTRLLLPGMLARRSGAIVNVSSMFGKIAGPEFPVYASSKFGLAGFGRSMTRQLAGTGVHIMTVYPAFTYTDMVSPGLEQRMKASGFQFDTPEYVAERTIDGLLKSEHDVFFGGLLERAGMWVERYAPRLLDLYFRLTTTPNTYDRDPKPPAVS